MSKPKRYTLRMPDISYGMREGLYGEYVRYEDYAKLKAEVEQLMIFCNCTLIPSKELQAQVERLTKAGDELHAFLINYIVESRISSAYLNKLDDDWNAAKEGKGQP